MKDSAKILTEVNRLSLSSICETETNRNLTSEQFKGEIGKRAKELEQRYSLRPGQSVVLLQSNNISFFVDFFALWILEVTAIPVDPSLKGYGLELFLEKIKPNLLIDFNEIKSFHNEVNPMLNNVALILFTSGSTSSPKGVLITKESLLKKMEVMKGYISASEVENALCFVPTYFGHGLICNSLFCIFNSVNFFISPKMTLDYASQFTELLKKLKITFFSTVPSHWEMILSFAKELEQSNLKRVHCASAPLRAEKIEPILKWLKSVPFYDIYGATEMLGWFAHRRILNLEHTSSFEIFWNVDKNFSKENELILKSEYMFKGYWNGSDVEIAVDFNTGDIFNGNKLVGRSKNIIIKNGQKINTDDLNGELLKSAYVKDVATFPVDDRFTGESIGVFVVLKDGYTIDEFKGYCRKNLASFKVPQIYLAVDKIPVNSRGKGSLGLLKKAYLELKQ